MTPSEELEHYACALSIAIGEIVLAVHDREDPRPHIQAALSLTPPVLPAPHVVDPYVALVTMMGAQITEPDATVGYRLRWLDPQVIAACQKPAPVEDEPVAA